MLIAAGLVLAVVVVVGFREARRARVRAVVLPELERLGVRAVTFGPTPVGFPVLVTLGPQRGEAWMCDHVGKGWFSRPVEFLAEGLDDDEVPYVVERLRRLGKVHTIQLRDCEVTERGTSALHEGLPDTLVGIHGPSGERWIRPKYRRLGIR